MASATAQALMKILVCRHHRTRFQGLLDEMEVFFDEANDLERPVLHRYLKRCSAFYSFVTVCVYLACLGFVLEPLLLSQPFPTDSSFPFAVEFRPLYVIIYVQQALAIFHIAAALSIDSQVALLFWYTAARFEMLGEDIEKCRCKSDLVRCITKHQSLLAYAEQHQPVSVKLRVGNMLFNASIELFVYAWPADKLMEMSQAIGTRAYKCEWLGKPISVQKTVLSLIHRSQKPVTISVGGFLPSLSLYYYASNMAKGLTSARNVVRLIKVCGRLTSTWPLDPPSSRRNQIFAQFLWWTSFLNVLFLIVPLIFGVYHYRRETTVLMKALSELTALTEVFFNLIICKFQRRRLQRLLSEITSVVTNASTEDGLVYQKYVDRYLYFLVTLGSMFFMTAVTFSCGPLVMKTHLPADAWYPFSVDSPTVRWSLYLSQVLAILQTGLCVTVDIMVGMMLWYTSASLEILGKRLERVTGESDLGDCIVEHQRITDFARETNHAVRFLILKGNATMALAAICGAFPLIYHQPILVVSQFILFVVCGLLRLYLTAWPADDLAEMSNKLGDIAYSTRWIEGSVKMRKGVLFVVQRSRKPLVISVTGILPALTLEFYASFASATMSYFVTLRAIIGE
ncbi:uncharacterized protein [Venturia canescens]|uniref:uncharacterized protein n=1 Tax=Venturia canescens TaxID=32260 RepID=UPI001C9CA816|nr:uncharacterized protein LOC122418410 [Venturia canescens]